MWKSISTYLLDKSSRTGIIVVHELKVGRSLNLSPEPFSPTGSEAGPRKVSNLCQDLVVFRVAKDFVQASWVTALAVI